MKRITIGFLCFALCSAAGAQQRLREGIVIDSARNSAYVMTPGGGIAAVSLTSGQVQWTTNDAAKPLALIGNRLVAQVETRTAAQKNVLQLAAIDVQQRGTVRARNAATLPGSVRAAVTETMEGRFTATATAAGADAVVAWTYAPKLLRGRIASREEEQEKARDGVESIRESAPRGPISGAVRLSLSTGAMPSVPAAAIPANGTTNATPTWVIPASEIDASPATQYESADGRHILTSERVADDSKWNKYRWIVTDRATGQRLGELRNHIAFAPFIVRDSVVVFETTPYILGDDEQPAKLRGVSLQSGREVWSVEVREVVYRGPMPP